MKRPLNRLAVILALAVGITTAQAQDAPMPIAARIYQTDTQSLVLIYKSPMVLEVRNKPKEHYQGSPDMIFKQGVEPPGVRADGINCVNRIEFFEDDPGGNRDARIEYFSKNPKCGAVKERDDGAIGTFRYRDSQNHWIEQRLYHR